ncbi:hypothetical protein HDK77DRAFT_454320 [Phyllosticta capitalensis]|uniref:Pentatricopeptide repeat protein n=1 Tax=Phyllosticta capitalensis TaxID=121624 RepID=A0ABR1YCT2_9PEZI
MRRLWSTAIHRLPSRNKSRFSRFFDDARRSQLLGRGGINKRKQGHRTPQGRAVAQNQFSATKSSTVLGKRPNNESQADDHESSPPVWRRVILERSVLVDYPVGPRPPAVKKLNASLRRGLNEPTNDTCRKELWKDYQRVKELHRDVFKFMPDEAWTVLWTTQSQRSPTNDNRLAHMKQLADHLTEFGSSKFHRAYLDDLFLSGKRDEASSEWLKIYGSNSDPVFDQPEFLEYGVYVLAKSGRLDYAEMILEGMDEQTLPAYKNIFEGLREFRPDDIDAAWDWYLRVHERFGDEMTDSDYEFFTGSFLNANALRNAQKIFEDMLRSRQFQLNFRNDQTKFFHQITRLTKSAKSTEEAHRMFLPLLNTLPANFQKGLFFNTWLERLLGLHDTEAAVLVVELAYESNCVPAPRIMDAILDSWVGSNRNLQLSEEIALRMVAQRREIIQRRESTQAFDGTKVRTYHSQHPKLWEKSEVWKQRPVPPATSATFSVLLTLFLQRLRKEGTTGRVRAEFGTLMHMLRKCKLPLDPKGLSLVVHYYLRTHNLRKVQETVMDFIENGPKYHNLNEALIALLWNACFLSIARRGSNFMKHPDRIKLRGPNVMKHNLSSFKSAWRGRARTAKKTFTSSRMTKIMIQCLCAMRNYEATLMTLCVLAKRFGILPTPKTIEIIAKSVASISFPTRSPTQRRLTAHSHIYQLDAGQLIQVMSQMFNMRVQVELERGKTLDDTLRGHLMVETLVKFLRITMMRDRSPQDVEEKINRIRKYWGVEDCSTGEQTALEIYLELYMNDALSDDGPGPGVETGHDAEPEQESGQRDANPLPGDEFNELRWQDPPIESEGEASEHTAKPQIEQDPRSDPTDTDPLPGDEFNELRWQDSPAETEGESSEQTAQPQIEQDLGSDPKDTDPLAGDEANELHWQDRFAEAKDEPPRHTGQSKRRKGWD